MRRSCKLTLKVQIPNEEIRARMGIAIDIVDAVGPKNLRRYDRVCRTDDDGWPKMLLERVSTGRRKK